MTSAVAEALVRAVPLTFERAIQGFTTSIMATSPILTEVFNEDHYIITIFNAPFEQYAGISVRLSNGERIRLNRYENEVPSEDDLVRIVEEYYRNRIEKFLSLPRYNNKNMKYIVKNKLTDAICGEFETKGQAGKWVEVYTNEQNVGLSPDDPRYCSPFDFELIEQN